MNNKHLKTIQRFWIINVLFVWWHLIIFEKKKFQTLKLLENVCISISNTSKKWAAGKEFKTLSTTVDYILSRILEVKNKVEKRNNILTEEFEYYLSLMNVFKNYNAWIYSFKKYNIEINWLVFNRVLAYICQFPVQH